MARKRDGEPPVASASAATPADSAKPGADRTRVSDAPHHPAQRTATDQATTAAVEPPASIAIGFQTQVSLRYVSKRRAFFDFLHSASKALSAIFGGAAFFSLIGGKDTTIAIWVTAALAVVTAVDTAVGFATRARRMDSQYRRYATLAAEIEGIQPGSLTAKRLHELKAKLLTIERDDPTVLTALNVMCHNEEAVARGYGEDTIYYIGWLQGPLAPLMTFPWFKAVTVAEKKAH